MSENKSKKSNSRYIRYLLLVSAALWVLWPISIMVEEGFRVDIGPLFSGRGASSVSYTHLTLPTKRIV